MKAAFAAVPLWAWIALAVIVVVALVGGVIIVALRRRASIPRVPEGVEDMPAKVHEVFTAAQPALHTRLSDRIATWIAGPTQPAKDTGRRLVVIGPAGAGKTSLLRQLARDATFAPAAAATPGAPCNIFRLEGGCVVEIAGRVLRDEDGKGRGGEAFQAVLSELKRAFPDRPVDGIVLALPLGALLPGAARDPIEEDARRLRKRIDEALSELAMRVPVYLVVTQCDRLTSFVDFGREAGFGGEPGASPEAIAARRDRVLGWSRPDGEDVVEDESADWVDEAFASVAGALTKEQVRRFAVEQPFEHASDYFVFPTDLATCSAALRWYVDPIFHDKAAGAPPELRGIYFCGQSAPPPSVDPSIPSPAPPILFAGELFRRKILPESNLAQPSVDAEKSRVRVIRVLQVASAVIGVVWGAFLAFDWTVLDRQTTSVRPFLEHLNSELVPVTAGEKPTAKYATRLLDAVANISTSRLRSYVVPTSLPSSIDTRVDDALALAFDQVVFASFRGAIEQNGIPEPDPPPTGAAAEIDPTVPLEKTPEFARTDEWLRRLETFSANVDRYNKLVQAHDERSAGNHEIQSIAELSESLFRHKLDPSFFSNAKYFTDPLNRPMSDDVRAVDVRALAPDAQHDADEVFDKLHARLFALNSGPVVPTELRELLEALRELEVGGPEYSTKKLRRLHTAIRNMEAHVGRDGLKWVPGDSVPPAPEKQDALYKRVEALALLLGPDVAQRLRSDAKVRLARLQGELRAAKAPLFGAVLARSDGDDRLEMKLAPGIVALKEPIDLLLRQPYMADDDEPTTRLDFFEDTRIQWDVDVLKSTAKTLKDYEAWLIDDPLKAAPAQARDVLRALAQRRIAAWTLGRVDRAARRDVVVAGKVPDHVLRADSDNCAGAGAPLREIVGTLGRVRVDDPRDQVRNVTRAQGVRVLRAVYRTLEAEGLYQGTFGWWNGDGTPAYRAFQVADAAQLAEYVVEQRTRADGLTRGIAEPVLALMQSPEIGAQGTPEVITWDLIAAALRDYEAKKAGNSVTLLERFILTELPAITDLDKCLALDKTMGRGRGDYFGERRRRLFDALRERCAGISRDDLRDWYDRLRLEFGRSLEGRFPFSRNEQAEDAQPEAVRAFILGATDFRKRYRPLLAARKDTASQDVLHFLDKIEAVRVFLAPLWAQNDSLDGAYDVRVEFRANAGRELGGNQIAEWSLRFADDKLALGGPKSSARWQLGAPMVVQLRWAKNSPDMPSLVQAPRVAVRDRTVTFEERGLWAMLRMMAGHLSALRDAESRSEGSNLLVFNVRTIPDPQGGFVDRVGTDSGGARVFIRLTPIGPEKDKPLRYPDFPTRAPVYTDELDKSSAR